MNRKRSTPKMGVPTRNKMYKYPTTPSMGCRKKSVPAMGRQLAWWSTDKPNLAAAVAARKKKSTPAMGRKKRSIPAMGKAGGTGSNFFAPVGALFKPITDMNNNATEQAKKLSDSKPGMHRVSKGKWVFNTPEDEARAVSAANNQVKGLNSIFNSDQNISMADRMNNISIPGMGVAGAVGGGYAGKKIGSWIGSAGKLIGPKHEKYGRQAGEYIGGAVGGVFGGLLSPI